MIHSLVGRSNALMPETEFYQTTHLKSSTTLRLSLFDNPFFGFCLSAESVANWFRYHFDGSTRKFFEGWYFKVSIPEERQSFCFMYSVESPAFPKKLSALEVAQYGSRFTGVGAQILGADDKYICQYSEESRNFWGSKLLALELIHAQ